MKADIDGKTVTGVLLAGGWSEVCDSSFIVHGAAADFKNGNQTVSALLGPGQASQAVTWRTERN